MELDPSRGACLGSSCVVIAHLRRRREERGVDRVLASAEGCSNGGELEPVVAGLGVVRRCFAATLELVP